MLLHLRLPLILAAVSGLAAASEQECVASANDPNSCLVVDSVEIDANGDGARSVTDDNGGMNASSAAPEDVPCEDDLHEGCPLWASLGECFNNPTYMHQNCRTSCESCKYFSLDSEEIEGIGNEECHDEHQQCTQIVSNAKCADPKSYVSKKCKKSCRMCQPEIFSMHGYYRGADLGEPQEMGTSATKAQISQAIYEGRKYMMSEAKTLEPGVTELCRNKHESCAYWASLGECDANPKYMKKSCAPVCKTCEHVTIESRCPIDPDAPSAWGPGDLNKMFTKLISEPYKSKYDVQILSSPDKDGPWVITMDNVISEEEAQKLIDLGAESGYERSADVGEKRPDGTYDKKVNDRRTSTNAWCTGNCTTDETTKNVTERIADLTEVPVDNSESLQMLRYEPGQFYQVHHDYIPHHRERQCGVRIATVYLYLNDVEAGGGTNFDTLDITVMPKRGRLLIWPSVLDEDPNKKDSRTTHQALPVEKGTKYGANAWLHQHDFKTPSNSDCI